MPVVPAIPFSSSCAPSQAQPSTKIPLAVTIKPAFMTVSCRQPNGFCSKTCKPTASAAAIYQQWIFRLTATPAAGIRWRTSAVRTARSRNEGVVNGVHGTLVVCRTHAHDDVQLGRALIDDANVDLRLT